MSEKSFSDLLLEMRSGETDRLLTAKMAEVCSAVAMIGKSGTVSLTIKIEPNGEGSVILRPDVRGRVPTPPLATSIFFVDAKDGSLHRTDPRQAELTLPEGVTYIGREKANG